MGVNEGTLAIFGVVARRASAWLEWETKNGVLNLADLMRLVVQSEATGAG
jgi:hypothetical protein